jgi:hypothetical protein
LAALVLLEEVEGDSRASRLVEGLVDIVAVRRKTGIGPLRIQTHEEAHASAAVAAEEVPRSQLPPLVEEPDQLSLGLAADAAALL